MDTKISIFQLIDKLKEIDVNEVIEKSKNITIEDLKEISWKDIKASKFTKPLAGISLFFIFIFIFLIPEIERFNSKNLISKEFSIKSRNLSKLENSLQKSLLIKSILDSNLEDFTNLTAKKSKIIKLTNLISESAKRSLIEVQEFSPIDRQELSSCSATSSDGTNIVDPLDFDQNNQLNSNNNFNEPFDPNDPFIDDGMNIIDFDPLEEVNKQIGYIDNNDNFLFLLSPKPNSNEIPNKLNDEFSSNYFKLEIMADYINLINFLRSIQEYRINIIPMCFEPSLFTQTSNLNPSQNSRPPGFIRAKLMIDVPTYKIK